MLKKFFSTSAGRVAAVLLILLIVVGINTASEQVVPFMVLSGIEHGKLKEQYPGWLKLPWYYSSQAVNGVAYVTHFKGGRVVVLFPQSPGTESNFTGILVTNQSVPIAKLAGCESGRNCMQIYSPQTAADSSQPIMQQVAVSGEVRPNLYTATYASE